MQPNADFLPAVFSVFAIFSGVLLRLKLLSHVFYAGSIAGIQPASQSMLQRKNILK